MMFKDTCFIDKSFDKLSIWKIVFNYKNPFSTLKISGNGLFILEKNSFKYISTKKNKINFINVQSNGVKIFTSPSLFSTDYRVLDEEVAISNVISCYSTLIFDAVYLNIPTLALNISKKKTFTNNLKTIELNITKEICSLNKLKKYFEEFNFDLESNSLLKKKI